MPPVSVLPLPVLLLPESVLLPLRPELAPDPLLVLSLVLLLSG
ncbi:MULTISPECIES: hypothetical protein [Actinosynnema]|nr:hypothetical protein [Actinosynnema pretiosum]